MPLREIAAMTRMELMAKRRRMVLARARARASRPRLRRAARRPPRPTDRSPRSPRATSPGWPACPRASRRRSSTATSGCGSRSPATDTVLVLDYRGAPYLRFTPTGVDVNRNSSMYYLNQTPRCADPSANLDRTTPPSWQQVSGGHDYNVARRQAPRARRGRARRRDVVRRHMARPAVDRRPRHGRSRVGCGTRPTRRSCGSGRSSWCLLCVVAAWRVSGAIARRAGGPRARGSWPCSRPPRPPSARSFTGTRRYPCCRGSSSRRSSRSSPGGSGGWRYGPRAI